MTTDTLPRTGKPSLTFNGEQLARAHIGGPHRAAVDANALKLGKLSVAEPVLDRKLHAVIGVLQAAEGVELPQQHAWYQGHGLPSPPDCRL